MAGMTIEVLERETGHVGFLPSARLESLDVDSLDRVEIAIRIEGNFDIEISDAEIDQDGRRSVTSTTPSSGDRAND